ncbi:hypothetical protein [Parvibaculum sp.]|uniref:hypothetical protein n=1 Tax=Parvibaculum sp. TaxID=2024848 RepID=UPI001B0BDE32|nr:hypothetical protein [Parvibaculum sp.]MBO6632945.1 hypothetical protein [Parvibaculum sp.]MBO6677723.1 hypothetical protein [Parvibaculum sp.]MBO6685133.1 hypothetical protein [Parvibaculum sp.]MBO6903356.1 hypothetical protein [Parvibaculum sp.]
MPNWDRINSWTNTLYALIQALHISNRIGFGNLTLIHDNIHEAKDWISPSCSYSSILVDHPFGDRKIKFRRDPNLHFKQISSSVVRMLVQDIVVIFDQMMTDILVERGLNPGKHPQDKVRQLIEYLPDKHLWSAQGSLELIAVRNILTHGDGCWNDRAIDVVKAFVIPPPEIGEQLVLGFPMLFRYRKAIRTFLNQVS